ncbi:hypothetical protein EW145_g5837 [Phellinidium pouzarii]|uniref:Eukaryotic translation initiation factor 4C n=1 Tax=Phellinidium pouzarii TaxID=167371 RepID=A0A4S4KYL3_9AGAM|nr:hypothetical protein EW145_g5837 [Phellinidium pouzarii]
MNKPFAGIPMNSKRKPDGVVLDSVLSNTEENEADWSDMHAIMRLRVTADSASFNSAFRQILDNARMIFCSQRIRRFVLGVIFISDNTMTFCVFDRSGVLCTERFDIMNDPEKLIRVVVGLLFADLIDLGYDPTVTVRVNEGGDGASKKEVVVALKNVEYTIEKTLHVERSIRGRGTTCFLTEHEGTKCVIKDSWVDEPYMRHEYQILEKISDVEGVPKIMAHEEVEVRGVKDTTATDRLVLSYNDYWKTKGEWKGIGKVERRVHHRILMTPYGEPLESFTCLHELMTAIKDIIKTIEELTERKVLHRDISINNVVLALSNPKDPKSRRRGSIIDFDLALDLNSMSGDVAKGRRTGTLPFMALQMMVSENYNNVPHAYYHDLESVLYVLCWLCTAQEGPNSTPRSRDFRFEESEIARWAGIGIDDPNLDGIRRAKTTIMKDDIEFGAVILDNFAPYFQPLRECVESMRELLVFSGLHKHVETHNRIIEEWRRRHVGEEVPLELLIRVPLDQRIAKDVFKCLYSIIDKTLDELEEPLGISPRLIPTSSADGDGVESLSVQQEGQQVKVRHIMERSMAYKGQKVIEELKKKEDEKEIELHTIEEEASGLEDVSEATHPFHKSWASSNLKNSPQNDTEVASNSGTLLPSFTLISTGTKRPNSPVFESELRSTNSSKKRRQYAQVIKMLGNGRLEAQCFDGEKRLAHIRGKMRKKVWINQGDIVLLSLREFQDDKADVIAKYTPDEARNLKAYGELPENAKLNEGDDDEGGGDVEFGDEGADGDEFDIEDI